MNPGGGRFLPSIAPAPAITGSRSESLTESIRAGASGKIPHETALHSALPVATGYLQGVGIVMKPSMFQPLIFAFSIVSASGSLSAQTPSWQPSPGHTQVPIWPGAVPDAQPAPGPEDTAIVKDHLVAGKTWLWVENVTQPTITVSSPTGKNTGVAVVVFPGGGFVGLA